MTSAIGKYAARKLLKGQFEKYKSKSVKGDKDPYFATVINPRTGKTKKVKKQVPDYIPEHDALILAKVRKRAYTLDYSLFNFFGIRFGWSSVVGIVPAVGDAIDGFLAWRTIMLCKKVNCGIPTTTLMLMYFLLALDILIGLVPFVGDLADAAVRVNSECLRLLEKRLDEVYNPEEKMRPKDRPKDRPQPATVYEDFGDSDEEGRERQYSGDGGVQQPQRARSSRRERQPDLEMGQVPSRSGTKTKKDKKDLRGTAGRDGPVRTGTHGRW
ncbi:uncharacterized protein BDZ99DRAFT_394328 [Mytilinidion resinicola]|uniref:PH domain-containing protein n=1 Tax=Mytilinidion resinicola TaxID=574789 RepID=A0A6A6YC75_9PEZI|nr:uncharacterized protein BDZ99DRAFT_394328 [Mytilinidion resinicola]KAF2806310.1 hypothetical protein BDZ99DRAFT_394328 [Mytilinidion resinicola]